MDGATFGKINGGGRGLSFVKRLVGAWGGQIILNPSSAGASFEISLPLMQTGVTFVGAPSSRAVAIIDDDEQVPHSLEKAGFTVLDAAANFEEGKKLLASYGGQDMVLLVDQDLGDGRLGSDLIGECGVSGQIYLCTNDFSHPDVIRRAKAIGVRILPKPLLWANSGL
jgi:hypothetical protein